MLLFDITVTVAEQAEANEMNERKRKREGGREKTKLYNVLLWC